jgi:beta-glucosidase
VLTTSKPPGYQLPSATAMGATFDTDLLYQVGKLLGDEGRRKNVQVALAPTVCIQRSPLVGRGFEAFGEDPVLSGSLAAQYVRGLQERGVASCIKHYAAHDQSSKSKEDDVHMTERSLREVHLLPFQIAMQARPWSVMSAYQKINGLHVSEDPLLLRQILRKEWGFDGLVISDWWGTYSTSEAINAGLDLEMPGPSIWRGRQLIEAVECRKVSMAAIDTAVENLLKLIDRTNSSRTRTSEVEGGDTPDSRALTRKVAADSIVLLKNTKNVLPLPAVGKASTTYGLIGEHFKNPATGGGGSSETTPFYVSRPLDAFAEVLSAENIRHESGCYSKQTCKVLTAEYH